MAVQCMTTRWPTGQEIMDEAVASGALIDATDIACEQGYEMRLYVTPEVMNAHGVAGLRAIVLVITTTPELCDGPAPIRVEMYDGGPDLNVAREEDGAVIVTMADGSA
ncbi:MAG: hypothetical protein IT372_22420 [Polyangiaceae bacterium]|nr:hypothetical protein [Polyangiaceae bacterium]